MADEEEGPDAEDEPTERGIPPVGPIEEGEPIPEGRARPFPEAVDGRRWEVEEGWGMTTPSAAKMVVPLDLSYISRNVRRREVLHARLGSKQLRAEARRAKVHPTAYRAAEQVICNNLLEKRLSMSLREGVLHPPQVSFIKASLGHMLTQEGPAKEPRDAPGAALMAVRTIGETLGTGNQGWARSEISGHPWPKPVAQPMMDALSAAAEVATLSREVLESTFGMIEGGVFKLDRKKVRVLAQKLNAILSPPPPPVAPWKDGLDSGWGDMKIQKPALVEFSAASRIARRFHSSDMGIFPAMPHRIITDGMAFRVKRRVQGGSLLLDCSGSMSLTLEQINMILKAAPFSTIALYEGDGQKGVLRIIAGAGKRARPEWVAHPVGVGANTVDGPALKWLSTQVGPRLWISDGRVTGRDECESSTLLQDVERLMKKHRISRVPHVKEALEYFTLLKRNPAKAKKLLAEERISYGRERGGHVLMGKHIPAA